MTALKSACRKRHWRGGMKTETVKAGKNGKHGGERKTARASDKRAERRREERRKLAETVVQHRIGVLKALEKH